MAETNNINTNGAAQATAALRTPRAQKREVSKKNESGLSVRDLILIAVLLAAGAVLKLTVSSFFSFAGMKPNFIIAMYCLAIILVRPKFGPIPGLSVFSPGSSVRSRCLTQRPGSTSPQRCSARSLVAF